MEKVRFMPAATWSPAFLGVPRAWPPAARPSLGQMVPALNLNAQGVQDIQAPMSQADWAAQTWTKEEAVATYHVANLLWAVREKIAFSAVLFRNLVADSKILAVINADPKGSLFVDATDTLIKLSQQLSLPNLMSSVRNLLLALEVNVLPKLGIEVRGKLPLFRGPNWAKPNILDCTQVGGTGPATREVLDFGNLCETSLVTDLQALQAATKSAADIAPDIGLSGSFLGNPPLPALAVFLIKFAAWVVGALIIGRVVIYPIVGKISEMVNPILTNPDFLEMLKRLTPEKAQQLVDQVVTGQRIWAEKAERIAMWIAIGLGAVAVAWVASSLISASAAKPVQPAVGMRRRG